MSAAPVTAAESAAGWRPTPGSSFYLAMRILPARQREAMFAIYAFCRAVDDIADEPGPLDDRHAALARWRRDLDALFSGRPPGKAAFLAEAVRGFGLRRPDFEAVIDGMEFDLAGPVRLRDEAALDWYCDCVASAVGRLSTPVFGLPEAEGRQLAHHLGRALQLTNILRDLDEDAELGRLYLPLSLLRAAGLPEGEAVSEPAFVLRHPALPPTCRRLAELAQTHFAEAEAIMAARPGRETRAPRLMAMAYRGLLSGLEARGFAPPRAPVKVAKGRLLLSALRVWLLS